MKGEKKIINEPRKFTGKQGLEVYERFERELDDKWQKLQDVHIQRSLVVGR